MYPNLNAPSEFSSGVALTPEILDASKYLFGPVQKQSYRQQAYDLRLFGDGSGTYGGTWRDPDPDREDDLREALLRAQLKEAQDNYAEVNRCLIDALVEKHALLEMIRILNANAATVNR